MNEQAAIHLDFKIDKLTNSIENAISSEVFDTIISEVTLAKRQIKKQIGGLIGCQN